MSSFNVIPLQALNPPMKTSELTCAYSRHSRLTRKKLISSINRVAPELCPNSPAEQINIFFYLNPCIKKIQTGKDSPFSQSNSDKFCVLNEWVSPRDSSIGFRLRIVSVDAILVFDWFLLRHSSPLFTCTPQNCLFFRLDVHLCLYSSFGETCLHSSDDKAIRSHFWWYHVCDNVPIWLRHVVERARRDIRDVLVLRDAKVKRFTVLSALMLFF